MVIRVLLLFLLLLSSSLVEAKPRIELTEAVRLAKTYIASNKIENTDRYLAKVNWHEDFKNPEKSYWIIYWAHNEPARLDAQLVVYVYQDGSIRHQDAWA